MPLLVVVTLGVGAAKLIYDYSDLAQSTQETARIAPQLTELVSNVDRLRELNVSIRSTLHRSSVTTLFAAERQKSAERFQANLAAFQQRCIDYSKTLGSYADLEERRDPSLAVFEAMRAPLKVITETIQSSDPLRSGGDSNGFDNVLWYNSSDALESIDRALETLHSEAEKLTSLLFGKLKERAAATKRGSNRLLWGMGIVFVLAAGAMIATFYLFSLWMTRPLHLIIAGARQVAAGDLAHRITLPSQHDEIAEIASAMNEMTRQFQATRNDLDRQVQDRTAEVHARTAEAARNERLASVGFLAAGVAHEINNPLAAIAMCAESLHKQLLASASDKVEGKTSHYLRIIQDEAFRCQGITERLLGLARAPSGGHAVVALAPLVEDMVAVLTTQGKYRDREITLDLDRTAAASVSPQEIKQVILNLLTNACEATDASTPGRVAISLMLEGDTLCLVVADNGCGMNDEVLKNVFEPFFTQRRSGRQGTGLGLSISHRIIADHGGSLTAASDGDGHGSAFTVRLPNASDERV